MLMNMKQPSKAFKFNLFCGMITLMTGLSFGLVYNFILNDSVMSIVSTALGFGAGNFIIVMGLIQELFKK